LFITFEGVGGAGKTTQAKLLSEYLVSLGRGAVLTHEPGGTTLGETLRHLLLERHDKPFDISAGAEAALFAAARSELVQEVISPALRAGKDVVCDRFIDSSLAYQGLGRGLGIEPVLQLNKLLIGEVFPDVTFLLLVDLDEALGRRRHKDRIERDDKAFRASLDRAYRQLAELFRERIVAVDGNRAATEIAKEIRGRLRDLS
jgi:dTMP kinase